jgi:hypothetical protein
MSISGIRILVIRTFCKMDHISKEVVTIFDEIVKNKGLDNQKWEVETLEEIKSCLNKIQR